MKRDWANLFLHPAMTLINRTNRRKLLEAVEDVESAQLKLLRSIMDGNRETGFGRDHNFSSIQDWQSYRNNVPIQNYASLEPYIRRQLETGELALVGSPVISLARTSGTTGPTKDIPMTAGGLEAVRDAQRQLALTLFRKTRFFDGKILALFSPHVEGRMKSGLAYGASSGQANRNTPFLFRSKYAYPDDIAAVRDYDLKYFLYALFGILEKNVTGIATANPSSICRLAEIINERREDLKSHLVSRDISRYPQLSTTNLTAQFHRTCRKKAMRVEELLRLLDGTGEIRLSDIWPHLGAAAVWTGGSCAVALERLKNIVPQHTKFVEIGYRASEFVGSVNIDADQNVCVPTVHHTLFEFVEQHIWESGKREFTAISDLQTGSNYYVFVTTSSGLYRYDINDIVQIGEHYHSCPSIQFLQKGKGVTSITGEKLYVHQVMTAVGNTQRNLGVKLDFCLLLADEATASYHALIETGRNGTEGANGFAEALDACLMETNIEYREKRGSGRLREPRAMVLKPGTGEAIKRHALTRGQRESQYKPPCLEYASKFDFDLDPWLEGSLAE
jgi:hypothetical protein